MQEHTPGEIVYVEYTPEDLPSPEEMGLTPLPSWIHEIPIGPIYMPVVPNSGSGPSLMNTAEAARWLCAPVGTLRSWRSSGIGPVYSCIERAVRYELADLRAFVQRARHISPRGSELDVLEYTSDPPNLRTTEEAAKWLASCPGTLRAWRSSSAGPGYLKLEGLVRYDVRDLQEYLCRCRRVPSVRANMEDSKDGNS